MEAILNDAEVPQKQREVLASVIDNLAWQRVKLDEAMQELKDASLTCEYDNGGGQTGTRENPLFKGYFSLWKAYLAGLEKYSAYLPKDLQEEIKSDTVDVLAQVRRMKREG